MRVNGSFSVCRYHTVTVRHKKHIYAASINITMTFSKEFNGILVCLKNSTTLLVVPAIKQGNEHPRASKMGALSAQITVQDVTFTHSEGMINECMCLRSLSSNHFLLFNHSIKPRLKQRECIRLDPDPGSPQAICLTPGACPCPADQAHF